jgi:hypothetical protein
MVVAVRCQRRNRWFRACACMHVFFRWSRAVERGAAMTGEGVPAWLRGVCLGSLLTSSHVIRGVGVGLVKRRGTTSGKRVDS